MPPIKTSSDPDQINEWTIMFYFGSDNPLAPLLVSQLKAIKDAGFQKKTDVLVYYDSNEIGTPTRVYNVNDQRKRAATSSLIGDEKNFVRNLSNDNVDFAEATFGEDRPFSKTLKESLNKKNQDKTEALPSLVNFINYGRESHKAKHYILFLVGHGMVVGNDAFLPDDAPKSAISLKDLGETLRNFSKGMGPGEEETFELLGLHSCSMSAVEVAYELKGTAKYMMASEGTSFVGSWPYRQLLKRAFRTIEEAADKAGDGVPVYDVETLVQKLYKLSLYTSTDFLLSGYSSDLSLCSLDVEKLKNLRKQIEALGNELKRSLTDPATKEAAAEAIHLAHWKAQSYWGEAYSDLYDFCDCLRKACASRSGLNLLASACAAVITELEPARGKERFSKLVIFSEHYGGKYQYSHGLSIFFPWSEPVEDPNAKVMENYAGYLFTNEVDRGASEASRQNDSWLSFLKTYFKETMRTSRIDEDQQQLGKEKDKQKDKSPEKARIAQLMASDLALFTGAAAAVGGTLGEQKASGAFEQKASGAVGSGCSCNSIKNYPPFSISPIAAEAFTPDTAGEFPNYEEEEATAARAG